MAAPAAAHNSSDWRAWRTNQDFNIGHSPNGGGRGGMEKSWQIHYSNKSIEIRVLRSNNSNNGQPLTDCYASSGGGQMQGCSKHDRIRRHQIFPRGDRMRLD